MNTPYDYICDSRNEIIIIGDSRIPSSMVTGRNLKYKVSDSNPRVVTLEQEALNYNPDN